MRTTAWLGVIFSTSALVACGGGGDDPDAPITPQIDSPQGTPDGRPDADPLAPDAAPEFACYMQPIPGTAPATLTVAGDVAELTTGGSVPKAGITVEAFVVGNPTAVDSDVSAGGTGAYSVSMSNPGMTPVDGFLRAEPGNNCGNAGNEACKNVFLFPPTLLYQDIPMAPVRTAASGIFTLIGALTQVTQTDDTAFIGVVVSDCLGNPLAGATISSNPPAGAYRYNNPATGLPGGPTIVMTDVDGVGYMMNVPGLTGTPPTVSVEVTAVYNGMQFRTHAILARGFGAAQGNAINTTVISP